MSLQKLFWVGVACGGRVMAPSVISFHGNLNLWQHPCETAKETTHPHLSEAQWQTYKLYHVETVWSIGQITQNIIYTYKEANTSSYTTRWATLINCFFWVIVKQLIPGMMLKKYTEFYKSLYGNVSWWEKVLICVNVYLVMSDFTSVVPNWTG